jgi:hypothetical protein
MNRLELLPKEISNYIYFLRDTNAIIKIQKRWHKYQAPKIIAMTLASRCYSSIDLMPDISSEYTAKVMEYMVNVLSGKEEGWDSFFNDIEKALLRDWPSPPLWRGGIYYTRIIRAFLKIETKFMVINIKDSD